MVCAEDWETRHYSDFLRVQRERIAVPFARPYPAEDTFIGDPVCPLPARTAFAGYAVAGCSIAGMNNYDWIYNPLEADWKTAIAGRAIAGYAISGRGYSLAPNN